MPRFPLFIWRLRRACRKYRIEVLNPHFIGLEHFSLMLFARFGGFHGPLLLSFHGSDIRSMIQTRGIERSLSRLLLKGAAALVPCSYGLGEEVLMLAPESARIALYPCQTESMSHASSPAHNITHRFQITSPAGAPS